MQKVVIISHQSLKKNDILQLKKSLQDKSHYMHFCREMCNFVNTRFLRPYGVIREITTKSPQNLYNWSSFSTHFTQKSSSYPLKSF